MAKDKKDKRDKKDKKDKREKKSKKDKSRLVKSACFHLISRLIRPLIWMGLLERQPEHDRTRIEQRRYRKTPLFDRFIRIASWQDGGWSIH